MNRSGIIFDVDGVLADSEPLSLRTARDAFQEVHGIAVDEAVSVEFVGMNSIRFFRELEKHYAVAANTHTVIDAHNRRLMKEIAKTQSFVFSGARELIDALYAESDLSLALATSSNRLRSEATLEAAEIATGPFSAWITGDDIRRPKPDPEMFLKAAQRLDVPPERCVVIEDSLMGVAAAKAAGMPCVAVCHTFEASRLGEASVIVEKIAAINVRLIRDLLR